jgi:hypothetical protein
MNDHTTTAEAPQDATVCALPSCTATIEQEPGRRPRHFCSPAHRVAAHRALRQAGESRPDELPDLIRDLYPSARPQDVRDLIRDVVPPIVRPADLPGLVRDGATCALPGCTAVVEQQAGERLRRYCGPAHRVAAHRARQRAEQG